MGRGVSLGAPFPEELPGRDPVRAKVEAHRSHTGSAPSQTTDHNKDTDQDTKDGVSTGDSQVRSRLFTLPPAHAHWSSAAERERSDVNRPRHSSHLPAPLAEVRAGAGRRRHRGRKTLNQR